MSSLRQVVSRSVVLMVTACLAVLGSVVVLEGAAFAASGTTGGTVSSSDPTYRPNTNPCSAGSVATHYQVIEAKLVGPAASTLTVTVTPTGFRASLGVYQGAFLPDSPIANCFGTVAGASTGAAVTYTTPLSALLAGYTEQTFAIVVAGAGAGDVGSFGLSVTSSNADQVVLATDAPPADTTPPVLSLPSTLTGEAAGPSGASVTYSATATDAVDGPRPVSCTPASGATYPLGTTTVTCSASDTSGNLASGHFDVVVRDTTPPALHLPSSIITTATGASGAVVSYTATVTATDAVDGPRPVSCTPASGTTFLIGSTTVNCLASDTRGNTRRGTFFVEVVNGTMTASGAVAVTGASKVGSTLTATSTLTTTPPSSSTSGEWLRDGVAIPFQTGTTYVLTSEDLGKAISYRQTDALAGFNNLVTVSNSVGPIGKGDISLAAPTISGTAQVDQTLTAVPGSVTPAGASLTYEWMAGADSLGTGTTYLVKPADVGRSITVEVTAREDGYADANATSAPTASVLLGQLAVSGEVTITGTAKVGQALTAVSTVTTTPEAAATGQWFRNGTLVPGATGTTYVLTNDDVSARLSYTETRTRDGYASLIKDTASTAVVTGGIITLDPPTIAGDAIVDQVLTATAGTVTPADADLVLTWSVDGTPVASGPTYAVAPGDVGKPITVTAQASKTDYDPVSEASLPTGDVVAATFATGPTAAITGVLRVGEELTASEGTPSPGPDSYSYQWYADGHQITGATEKTFTLTPAQKGAGISVEVTAVRAGYVDAVDTSAVSAAVVTNLAPALSLRSVTAAALRLGQSATLAWTSGDALSLEASGAWSGAKASAGQETVTPASTGTAVYVLTATNGSGTTTAQVAVSVGLPAASLKVTMARSVLAGHRVRLKARGLAPRERYTVTIGGVKVASGTAKATGLVKRKVPMPSTVRPGHRVVRVTGSFADRTGTRRVTVKRALTLDLGGASVRASDRQSVTVRGLRPHAPVTLTYQGRRLSGQSARANAAGVYTLSFDVGTSWGRFPVTVRSDGHGLTQWFTVVRRCPQGGHVCA